MLKRYTYKHSLFSAAAYICIIYILLLIYCFYYIDRTEQNQKCDMTPAVPVVDLVVILLTGAVAVLLACMIQRRVRQQSDDKLLMRPPLAAPHIPVLGNALQYKKCPSTFLCQTAARYGPVFRLNLAGMETTVVCSAEAMRQFAFAPESVLSAKEAVSDLGFDYTLGTFNVSKGTDIHKKIIKANYFTHTQLGRSAAALCRFIDEAMQQEVSALKDDLVPDFITFVRKIVLSALIQEMLGPELPNRFLALTGGRSLVDDFIVLQDGIEDATARAAVTPAWLARPLFLNAAASRRNVMVSHLQECLELIWESPSTDSEQGMMRISMNVLSGYLFLLQGHGSKRFEMALLCLSAASPS